MKRIDRNNWVETWKRVRENGVTSSPKMACQIAECWSRNSSDGSARNRIEINPENEPEQRKKNVLKKMVEAVVETSSENRRKIGRKSTPKILSNHWKLPAEYLQFQQQRNVVLNGQKTKGNGSNHPRKSHCETQLKKWDKSMANVRENNQRKRKKKKTFTVPRCGNRLWRTRCKIFKNRPRWRRKISCWKFAPVVQQ